jgi:hypothetical protein
MLLQRELCLDAPIIELRLAEAAAEDGIRQLAHRHRLTAQSLCVCFQPFCSVYTTHEQYHRYSQQSLILHLTDTQYSTVLYPSLHHLDR